MTPVSPCQRITASHVITVTLQSAVGLSRLLAWVPQPAMVTNGDRVDAGRVFLGGGCWSWGLGGGLKVGRLGEGTMWGLLTCLLNMTCDRWGRFHLETPKHERAGSRLDSPAAIPCSCLNCSHQYVAQYGVTPRMPLNGAQNVKPFPPILYSTYCTWRVQMPKPLNPFSELFKKEVLIIFYST